MWSLTCRREGGREGGGSVCVRERQQGVREGVGGGEVVRRVGERANAAQRAHAAPPPPPMRAQVTADGVPVIWHDNYLVHGEPSAPGGCA